MPDDGFFVEFVGVLIVEGCACGNQRVGHDHPGGWADAEFDAGGINTLFLNQVLTGVEGALCGGLGLLIRRRVANHDEVGVGLLRKREGDVVEAALGFVVDAFRATAIACEAQAAERLGLRGGNDGRSDDDVGGRFGGLSEIVDQVAGNGDGHWTQARGGEGSGGSRAADYACRGAVGVRERTILRADADGADGDVGTGDRRAGIGAAGEGGRLEGLDGEGRSAGCLLARFGAFLYMSRDDVVSGRKVGCINCRFGAGGVDLAAIGSPGVNRSFLRIQVQGVGFNFNGIAREDACGLSSAAEHDGLRRFDVAHADNKAGREFEIAECAEAALLSSGKEERTVNDLGALIVRLNGTDSEVLTPEGQHVIEANTAGGSPSPHQRLGCGSVGALTAAEYMGERHPAS